MIHDVDDAEIVKVYINGVLKFEALRPSLITSRSMCMLRTMTLTIWSIVGRTSKSLKNVVDLI